MRSIKQVRDPLALRKWKKQNLALPHGKTYPPHSDIVSAIKVALHKEQMGLCAYTLRKLLAPVDGHVEHIEPQNQHPSKALDYANMVLCFPRDGGDRSPGYGAPVKGGQHVQLNVNFVSPHGKGCEQRFIYKTNGKVLHALGDTAAEETIDLLKLNCSQLVELRLAAIGARGLTLRKARASRRPVQQCSVAEANRLAVNILKPDARGRLEEFCIALQQAALQYAKDESARSKVRVTARKKP